MFASGHLGKPALDFTLGRVPFYFEHHGNDEAGKSASWYRLYDNPVTERHNHVQQHDNEVGGAAGRTRPAPGRRKTDVTIANGDRA